MRKILLVVVFACCALASLSVMAEEQTVTMIIEKMHCAMCPITVRKAMEKVDGVLEVNVDYETKTATVTFDDSTTTVAEVAQASTDVGYPAAPVNEE